MACLEGSFAIELAKLGAKTVGIEIREANIEKAIWVKNILGLDNASFFQDDVRNLKVEKYGLFDVVICSGILYHLDSPDNFYFIDAISKVCQGFTIFDTHISLTEEVKVTHNKVKYYGRKVREHLPEDVQKLKADRLWASIDNNESLWLTPSSFYQALYTSGFTSIYECRIPQIWPYYDRATWVAIKGKPLENLNIRLYSKPQRLTYPQQQTSTDLEDREILRVKEIENLYIEKFSKILEELGFNDSVYYQLNPDVAQSGMDAKQHYLQFGINEGRKCK